MNNKLIISPYRGFNLLEKFQHEPDDLSIIAPEWSYYNEPFKEKDFAMIAELGFDFVRLPMSYKCWIKNNDWLDFDEDKLVEIDQAIAWGKQYNIHVSINIHRAPGFCINPPFDTYSLWKDEEVLEVFAKHWEMFAKRYKGIPSKELSFDLLNEPVVETKEHYIRAVEYVVNSIRAIDPDRLIIAEGIDAGKTAVAELSKLNIVQSARGYEPHGLTCFKATWTGQGHETIAPQYPFVDEENLLWNKEQLREYYKPWKALSDAGVSTHVGEWGVYNKTPHNVTLDFMKDMLSLYKEYNWGWALWCFRGSFGILDSGREDVNYEDFHGHKLDRKMLELLKMNNF